GPGPPLLTPLPLLPLILGRVARGHPYVEELACGVEDAEAFRRRIAPPEHLPRKLKRLAQVGEPALFPVRHATTRLPLAPRDQFSRVVRHCPRPPAPPLTGKDGRGLRR